MNKKIFTNIKVFMVVCVMILSALCIQPNAVYADGGMDMSITKKTKTVHIVKVGNYAEYYMIKTPQASSKPFLNSYNKVSSVKFTSSKSSVIKTAKFKNGSATSFQLIVKKAGTSNIKLSYKMKGKKYTYKFKVQAHKYENPFASFKVNGKEVKAQFNNVTYGEIGSTADQANYTIAAKSGWTVKSVKAEIVVNNKITVKKVGKTGVIKDLDNYPTMIIEVQNNKTKLVESIYMSIYKEYTD